MSQFSPLKNSRLLKLKIWNDQLSKRAKDQIMINLGNESVIAIRNFTRPMDLKQFSNGLVAKIDNNLLWEMGRPLEKECTLKVINETSANKTEYSSLLGNSGAVLLGCALEKVFPHLVLGSKSKDINPFYLDLGLDDASSSKHLNQTQLDNLTSIAVKLGKECIPFERIDVELDVAQEMFQYSPLKSLILSKMNGLIPLVKLGDFIDICNGSVVAHSGQVSALKCLESSSSILNSDSGPISLNRIHAVAFPTNDMLQTW